MSTVFAGAMTWRPRSSNFCAPANHAVVRGYRADNPLQRLAKAEKPRRKNLNPARVLTSDEIANLIKHALPTYRPSLPCLPTRASDSRRPSR